MDGDQRSLKLQGAWTSVTSPMTLMSTWARAIQAGIAIHTSPRGRPEEKEGSTTERRRQLVAIARIVAQVLGLSVKGRRIAPASLRLYSTPPPSPDLMRLAPAVPIATGPLVLGLLLAGVPCPAGEPITLFGGHLALAGEV